MGLDPILKQGKEGAMEEEEAAVKRHYPFSPDSLSEGGGRRVWHEVEPGKKVGGICLTILLLLISSKISSSSSS